MDQIDKEKLFKRAKIELIVTQDDIPVRGNAIASGDPNIDCKVEEEILDRLDSGDVWAWADVEVRASYGPFKGSDFLGCCSYKDEKDFRAGGYYNDMVDNALEELRKECERSLASLGNVSYN